MCKTLKRYHIKIQEVLYYGTKYQILRGGTAVFSSIAYTQTIARLYANDCVTIPDLKLSRNLCKNIEERLDELGGKDIDHPERECLSDAFSHSIEHLLQGEEGGAQGAKDDGDDGYGEGGNWYQGAAEAAGEKGSRGTEQYGMGRKHKVQNHQNDEYEDDRCHGEGEPLTIGHPLTMNQIGDDLIESAGTEHPIGNGNQ